MGDFKPVIVDNLPRFYGGLVGFFSYEIINQIENISKNSGVSGDFPDSLFMLTDSVIIFDNINKTAKIVINAYIKDSNKIDKYYKNALSQINKIEKLLLDYYDLEIEIQNSYMIIENDSIRKDFTWIGRVYPYRWLAFFKLTPLRLAKEKSAPLTLAPPKFATRRFAPVKSASLKSHESHELVFANFSR